MTQLLSNFVKCQARAAKICADFCGSRQPFCSLIIAFKMVNNFRISGYQRHFLLLPSFHQALIELLDHRVVARRR